VQRIGWGVVGTGRIASTEIAPAVRALDNSTLVGVVSRDLARAQAFAAAHGEPGRARAHDDLAALLADPDVDAVYVATPNALHAEQVVAAARAGKHVLCDKPLATSVEDAERVVQACESAGVQLGITFQTRRHEGMAEVRDLVAAGEIGRVVLAEVEMSPGRTLLKGWRTDPALAGAGTTNNVGVHAYDLLRFVLGEEVVEATAALGHEPGLELDTVSLALLRFTGGALAYVNVNQATPHSRPDLVLHGTEGRVLAARATRPHLQGEVEVLGRSGERRFPVDTGACFTATVGAFADAVLHGRAVTPSGQDGLVSARLVEALMRSAREGRTVRLPA
jgi:1,5-anhydro-D-fructose reductase (1,5-anhydro-D-mannitol-forming)